ncbi:MAG: S8 family serine peptidase [Acidimicrobiia bacterium]|nr:S8 family serine peptidase [Acidimicrobiia bacterium]
MWSSLPVDAAPPTTSSGAARPLAARVPASKATNPTRLGAGGSSTRIDVKFREGSGLRLLGGAVARGRAADAREVRTALGGVAGWRAERLVSEPEAAVTADRERAEERSGRRQADLNLWYRVTVPAGTDVASVVDRLNALDAVEVAYAEPQASPPPTTPSFVSKQHYRDAAPTGIGANALASTATNRGSAVQITDIEYSWNRSHEDLDAAAPSDVLIANGTPVDPFTDNDHGTAVLGELVGTRDALGVTGVATDAQLRLINAYNTHGYELTNAINLARTHSSPGDVILVEQQIAGANGGCNSNTEDGCVAAEWVPSVYDAIALATAAGITVVEPAGNGDQNLDAAEYGTSFPGGRPDSGAVIVGAGEAPCRFYGRPTRSRLDFSSYGSRVDVQGWGECVVTTGYGDLQSGGPNHWYTQAFSGTSSAAPMVAGAAAVVSSSYESAHGTDLTPQSLRARLIATGTPQNFGAGALAGEIGPLPNLVAALAAGPADDSFSAPTALTDASGSVSATNVQATREVGEPDHGDVGGASVWFTWTSPVCGTVTFTTAGSDFDTLLGIYTGTKFKSLKQRAVDDDGGGGTASQASYAVSPGTVLDVAVDGAQGAQGSIALAWSTAATPDPLADAGDDATARADADFTIDASRSCDPLAEPLTYAWVQLTGPAVEIEDPTAVKTTVTGPHKHGESMTFQVTVTDGSGNFAVDTVTISTK